MTLANTYQTVEIGTLKAKPGVNIYYYLVLAGTQTRVFFTDNPTGARTDALATAVKIEDVKISANFKSLVPKVAASNKNWRELLVSHYESVYPPTMGPTGGPTVATTPSSSKPNAKSTSGGLSAVKASAPKTTPKTKATPPVTAAATLSTGKYPETDIPVSTKGIKMELIQGQDYRKILHTFFTEKHHKYGTLFKFMALVEAAFLKAGFRVAIEAAEQARAELESGEVKNVVESIYWVANPPVKIAPDAEMDLIQGSQWRDEDGKENTSRKSDPFQTLGAANNDSVFEIMGTKRKSAGVDVALSVQDSEGTKRPRLDNNNAEKKLDATIDRSICIEPRERSANSSKLNDVLDRLRPYWDCFKD